MSALPHTFSTEEERVEAAKLAAEPSDEQHEATLRDEAHHNRPTAYAQEARDPQPVSPMRGEGDVKGDKPTKSSHTGETSADVAQRDRELYGVRDTTKLDSVRCCGRATRRRVADGARTGHHRPAHRELDAAAT